MANYNKFHDSPNMAKMIHKYFHPAHIYIAQGNYTIIRIYKLVTSMIIVTNSTSNYIVYCIKDDTLSLLLLSRLLLDSLFGLMNLYMFYRWCMNILCTTKLLIKMPEIFLLL